MFALFGAVGLPLPLPSFPPHTRLTVLGATWNLALLMTATPVKGVIGNSKYINKKMEKNNSAYYSLG